MIRLYRKVGLGPNKKRMDWVHPVIVDAIWSRLASWEWLWSTWSTLHTRRMLTLPCKIRSLSRVVRRELPWKRFWEEAQRPSYRGHLMETLPWIRLEFRLRRLVAELHRWGEARQVPLIVAGGFAAWQYAATLKNPSSCRSHWQPGDIDLFVGRLLSDVELEELRIVYSRYSNAEHDDFAHDLPVVRVTPSYEYTEETARFSQGTPTPRLVDPVDARTSPLIERFASVRRALNDTWNGHMIDLLRQAPARTPKPLSIQRVLRIQESYALSLNVVELKEGLGLPAKQFGECVLGTFDILPCAIGVDVDPAGQWRFHPLHPIVTDSIHDRRLCFSTRLFDTEERLLKTLIRGMKYRGYGFRTESERAHETDAHSGRRVVAAATPSASL